MTPPNIPEWGRGQWRPCPSQAGRPSPHRAPPPQAPLLGWQSGEGVCAGAVMRFCLALCTGAREIIY